MVQLGEIMKVRLIILGLFLVYLTGCSLMQKRARYIETTTTHTDQHTLAKKYEFEYFKNVRIDGDIDITLEQSPNYEVSIIGDVGDMAQVRIKNLGHAITLYAPATINDDKKHPHVVIKCPYIERLVYNGNGRIDSRNLAMKIDRIDIETAGEVNVQGGDGLKFLNARGLGKINLTGTKTDALHINTQDRVAIHVDGTIGLRELKMTGSGWLRVYWVDSPFLRVKTFGNSFAQVAGVVNTLELYIHDESYFNGRYLRVEKAYTRARDGSRADVFVKDLQTSTAMHYSNIYNYYKADVDTMFMQGQGSILSMMGIE